MLKLEELECLYASMIKNNTTQDCFLVSQFITACSTFCQRDYEIRAFTQIEIANDLDKLFVGRFGELGLHHMYMFKLHRMNFTRVFDEIPNRDGFAWTTMVTAHARVGDLGSARRLLDDMPERNTASWNSIIAGYARLGDVESAEFFEMLTKDLISWTTMINCYCQNKKYKEAVAVFNEMKMMVRTPTK
ncbi:LOW QUALITY PROTEIN: hypothetical protein RJ640_005422 [Escallonia rubra]|uniref:Pentatricopeptide repeat-containing protein n=1 Tax=Escallonia rubra TaxID=112253 RepID=A0AA88R0J6_9ASTE|nr:LOW QUALITY PROTEIN: hypothetical protein RJ640_005422 [Escallonia rubra]